jgi:adenylate cyclase
MSIDLAEPPDAAVSPSASQVWTATPVIEWLILEAWRIEAIPTLLQELAERLVASGVPLWRLFALVPMLHPQYVGSGHRWQRGDKEMFQGFGVHGIQETPTFRNNPLKLIILDGYDGVRRRINRDYRRGEFPLLDELQDKGGTDYVCLPIEFAGGQRSAVSFASDHPDGFSLEDLKQFNDLAPVLSRLVERETLRQTAVNLLDTYVGREAGARVLKGQITRGSGESLDAAIWYSDLRNFTSISDASPRDEVIQLLNDYFEAMAQPVQRHGGQVLKFIGDGMLAIFPVGGDVAPAVACGRALDAAHEAEELMAVVNDVRLARSQEALDFGLALHLGEVMYGNIGAVDRLDFTVIGPAVNLAHRLESLCKVVHRRPIVSRTFAELSQRPASHLGRFELKGLTDPYDAYLMAR